METNNYMLSQNPFPSHYTVSIQMYESIFETLALYIFFDMRYVPSGSHPESFNNLMTSEISHNVEEKAHNEDSGDLDSNHRSSQIPKVSILKSREIISAFSILRGCC